VPQQNVAGLYMHGYIVYMQLSQHRTCTAGLCCCRPRLRLISRVSRRRQTPMSMTVAGNSRMGLEQLRAVHEPAPRINVAPRLRLNR
jgi:hypothetical protein